MNKSKYQIYTYSPNLCPCKPRVQSQIKAMHLEESNTLPLVTECLLSLPSSLEELSLLYMSTLPIITPVTTIPQWGESSTRNANRSGGSGSIL